MQVVRIRATWFETGGWGVSAAVFEAGKDYPLTDASQRQIDLGNADLVEVADPESESTQAEAAAPAPAKKK